MRARWEPPASWWKSSSAPESPAAKDGSWEPVPPTPLLGPPEAAFTAAAAAVAAACCSSRAVADVYRRRWSSSTSAAVARPCCTRCCSCMMGLTTALILRKGHLLMPLVRHTFLTTVVQTPRTRAASSMGMLKVAATDSKGTTLGRRPTRCASAAGADRGPRMTLRPSGWPGRIGPAMPGSCTGGGPWPGPMAYCTGTMWCMSRPGGPGGIWTPWGGYMGCCMPTPGGGPSCGPPPIGGGLDHMPGCWPAPWSGTPAGTK
mmetsp:Transcript_26743/g.89536  ORF Transcript_26743/g.89536 Transcript_26743/m.89536 type:complete len:260 (-) Transcript_26743:325-1104(-)